MSVWNVDDTATVWRGTVVAGIHPVAAVANGVVTLTDGTRWAMAGGTPLGGGAKLGERIAHTLETDTIFVERARAVARCRELAGWLLTGKRAYHIPTHDLRDIAATLERAIASAIRHNYRGAHSDRTDRYVQETLAALERDIHRAEALELESRYNENP